MIRQQRRRRVQLLCIHFTRNLAYSRAISTLVPIKREGDFWITMQGNCLDTAVLEWCKLFGERTGKHAWQKMVDKPEDFRSNLRSALEITQSGWDECWSEIRLYRNTFVAHLDSKNTMNIPTMDLPKRMVTFYYNHILGSDNGRNDLPDLPLDLNDYYEACYRDAGAKIEQICEPEKLV